MPRKRKNSSLSKKVTKLMKKVSQIDTTIERKTLDIQTRGQLSVVLPFPALCHNCIDLSDQGTDVNQRIGNKITVRQVQIRSTLVNRTVAALMVRAVVVQWVNNQTAPVAADINYVLDYDAPTSPPSSINAMNCPYLINSKKKYRVLDDRIIRLAGNQTNSSVKLMKKYFTFKGKNSICEFENITPQRADPSNNQISLFLIPAYPVGTIGTIAPTDYFIESRTYYQDA